VAGATLNTRIQRLIFEDLRKSWILFGGDRIKSFVGKWMMVGYLPVTALLLAIASANQIRSSFERSNY